MSFILILLFIIVAIFVFGISIIGSILRALFGFGKRAGTNTSSQQQQNTTSEYRKEPQTPKAQKKIFDKDDGEYVEFEEIKEED
ncbi:MAG: DUF4834 family protein [Bacteroides sp.]|nr:DUF4834 family protein [Bacteroides sp.]